MSSIVSTTQNTLYLFSCDKCAESLWKGGYYADYKIEKKPDFEGLLTSLFVEIGNQSYWISKGYYKKEFGKKLISMTQDEVEQIFGKHDCSSISTMQSIGLAPRGSLDAKVAQVVGKVGGNCKKEKRFNLSFRTL